MPGDPAITVLSRLSAASLGTFRGRVATTRGVTRDQLTRLLVAGAIERMHPDVYRMTAVPTSHEQRLRAALLWAGDGAAATGRSAASLYGLEGVDAEAPEIAVPSDVRLRSTDVVVRRVARAASMVRRVRGFRITGPEYTLVLLAHTLEEEAFEIACEDARRRRLTSIAALRAYLDRFGQRGRPGVAPMRRLLRALDVQHPSRSTLEVKARRLLVAHGMRDFVRELPLAWNGRTHRFDFAFPAQKVILETNGRQWHDDPVDFEHDQEKWSVPGRHGYRLVLATWDKVTNHPHELVAELRTTMAARGT